MSFQAYLDNIQAKTGKSPADFRRLAWPLQRVRMRSDRAPWERGKRYTQARPVRKLSIAVNARDDLCA